MVSVSINSLLGRERWIIYRVNDVFKSRFFNNRKRCIRTEETGLTISPVKREWSNLNKRRRKKKELQSFRLHLQTCGETNTESYRNWRKPLVFLALHVYSRRIKIDTFLQCINTHGWLTICPTLPYETSSGPENNVHSITLNYFVGYARSEKNFFKGIYMLGWEAQMYLL